MKWFRKADTNAVVLQDDYGATLLEVTDEMARSHEAAIKQLMEQAKQQQVEDMAKAQHTMRDLQLQLQRLKTAISSIVLRLKVLDLDQLAKDLGEDGTVPLRMALSELRQLVEAYDGIRKKTSYEDMTTVASGTWGPYMQQQANWTSNDPNDPNVYYYWNYGKGKP